ncbi:hypothetical protein GCM10023321_70750 [Pseudonocardia eucalypti]|uniref:Uncharacterized protein n=1 Tax=Pseudonocardia eucalypti TaxID=648755 RepID=A0ABP9R5H8_9PSEU|nr:hypothetical protein [Pseudonocardia eucalypti]
MWLRSVTVGCGWQPQTQRLKGSRQGVIAINGGLASKIDAKPPGTAITLFLRLVTVSDQVRKPKRNGPHRTTEAAAQRALQNQPSSTFGVMPTGGGNGVRKVNA